MVPAVRWWTLLADQWRRNFFAVDGQVPDQTTEKRVLRGAASIKAEHPSGAAAVTTDLFSSHMAAEHC